MSVLRVEARSVRLSGRPVGQRQGLAYGLVAVALRSALTRLEEHRLTPARAGQRRRSSERAEIERRLGELAADAAPEMLAAAFELAVLWSEDSATAAETVARLVGHYRAEHGLVIDVEAGTVDVDTGFGAVGDQDRRLEQASRERERRACVEADRVLGEQAALMSERFEDLRWVPVDRASRDSVRARLLAFGVDEACCRTAVFVLAFLSGHTDDMNFVEEAPVLVDPGEEIKPALDREIDAIRSPTDWFAGVPDPAPSPWWDTSVALLRVEDRVRANAARAAAVRAVDAAGVGTVPPLWPEHTDREALYTQLTRYRGLLDDFVAAITEMPDLGAADDRTWELMAFDVGSLRQTREVIEAAVADGRDLLEIEHIRVRDVLESLDLGDAVPQGAVFAGALHLRGRDQVRLAELGDRFADTAAATITELLHYAGKPPQALQLDFDGPQEYDDLDQWSIFVRLSRIARHDHARDQSRRELTSALDTLFTASVLTGPAASVLRRQLDGWLDVARAQGDLVAVHRMSWDEHLAQVCAARDTPQRGREAANLGQLREVVSPETASHAHVLINAALLPRAAGHTISELPPAQVAPNSDTIPGTDPQAQP